MAPGDRQQAVPLRRASLRPQTLSRQGLQRLQDLQGLQGQGDRKQIGLGRRWASILLAASTIVGLQTGSARAAEVSIRVKAEVRGTQRTDAFKYQYEMFCARTNGSAILTSENKEQFAVTVGKGETVTVGTKEFPNLTMQDACWIRMSAGDGSETTYKSSNGMRADGSVRDASPGLISSGGYRSAPALATGELITATHSYTGDLVVTNRVDGIPANGTAIVAVSIRCDNQGISRNLNLSDGDRELITGIPTGSSCRVSTLAGRSRTEDNSGSPSDGVVVITPIRSECLDLRNAAADCRATVFVTTSYEPALDPTRVADPNQSTTSAPTTTNPDDANRQNDPAQAAPATAAPAVAPAPAVAVDATPVFTG